MSIGLSSLKTRSFVRKFQNRISRFKSYRNPCVGDLDECKPVLHFELSEASHDVPVLDIRRKLVEVRAEEELAIPSSQSSTLRDEASTACSFKSSTSTYTSPRVASVADFDVIKLLGTGGFGHVYEVHDQISKAMFALKIIAKGAMNDRGVQAIIDEQKTLRKVGASPWQLSIEASWHDTENFYILMPVYVTDLDCLIHVHAPFIRDVSVFYSAEIYIAIKELHEQGIAHRDIKAANVLIDYDGHIVLADFGVSKDYGRAPTLEEFTVLPYWSYLPGDPIGIQPRHPSELYFATREECVGSFHESPPEAFESGWNCFGADRWGAATIIYRMATGRYPWNDPDPTTLKRKICYDPLEFLPDDHCVDRDTKNYLMAALDKIPQDRLEVGVEVENHPFFSGVDWYAIARREVPPPWVPGPAAPTQHLQFGDPPPMFRPGDAYELGTDPCLDFIYTGPALLSPDNLSKDKALPETTSIPAVSVRKVSPSVVLQVSPVPPSSILNPSFENEDVDTADNSGMSAVIASASSNSTSPPNLAITEQIFTPEPPTMTKPRVTRRIFPRLVFWMSGRHK